MKFFLERCRDFFATASSEIRKRFPIDNPTVKLLKVIDPKVSHIEFPSIAPLASRFPNLVPTCQLQQLDNEWRLLGCSVVPLDGTLSIDQYWGNLSEVKNGSGQLTFPTLSAFMKGLLSLPHSNADTERVFSAVNLIKTKTRNKLKCRSLEALLSAKEGIKYGSGIDCTRFNPSNDFLSRMTSTNLYCDHSELDDDIDRDDNDMQH